MPRPRSRPAPRLPYAVVAALLAGCVSPAAQADAIDRHVEAQLAALHLPGLALAIIHDGRVVKAKGYGLADLENRVPATPDTVWEIGSLSKQFTAVLVAMLVDEGRLRLDDSLAEFFPGAPPFWQDITLHHLLTHTGGITNHVAVPGFMDTFGTDLAFGERPDRAALLARFRDLPREFTPGATWAYDNTGYILLGWILEQVSGRSYWQLLEERIFAPLGMSASGSTDPRRLVPHRAAGYGRVNGAFENRSVLWPHVGFSAGSIGSSARDLAKWALALDGDSLLRGQSRERLWTAAALSDGTTPPFGYGFGWFVDSWHGHRVVQHGGGTPGFSSAIWRFPDDRLTVVLLTNHGDRILDPLAIDIAGLVEPVLRRPERHNDPDPATSARLRTILADLLAGRPDARQLTPPLRLLLATATGRSLWGWIAGHGTLDAFTLSDIEERDGERVLRYRVVLGGTRYWFSFRLTAGGSVAQVTTW